MTHAVTHAGARRMTPGRRLSRYILSAALVLAPEFTAAQYLDRSGAVSLFSDVRAHAAGDLITILIMEESSAASTAKTDTDKNHELKADGGGTGALSRIPLFGLNGTSRNTYSGAASTSRTGTLRAKMTARIVEVLNNGNFVIEGSRSVKMNNETETTVIRGVVRPRDISPTNTVLSYNIADVKISHSGKGAVNSGQRPGLIVRFLNWIL